MARWLLCLVLVLPCCAAAVPLLRETGTLTVAVYRGFGPFSLESAEGLEGVDVALARALARQLNLKLKFLPFNAGEDMADDLRNMVWRGDVLHYGPADIMLHVPVDRRFSAANEQALIFAPYYRETLVFLRDTRVLPNAPTAADLIGKSVAAEQGTAAASALLGAENGALRATTKITSTPEIALHLLFDHEVAGVLVTRAQAEAALRRSGVTSGYAISPLALNSLPANGWAVGVAVKAENTELADEIVRALQGLSAAGEVRAIFGAAGLTLVNP